MKKRIKSVRIITISILLVLSACAQATPAPTTAPTNEPVPQVMADCFISFSVAAWQDLNGDGLWDADEPALDGVEYQLAGMYAQKFDPESDLDKGEGWYSILIWSPGECIEQEYTLTAIPPQDYQATTPAAITFSNSLPMEAQFGFQAAQ